MMIFIRLCFILLFINNLNSQSHFEVGYSFGANATTSRTIKSGNMTWGYYTPPLPNTWSNHWSIGYGNTKNRFYLAFDGGGLGPTWRAKGYTNKYPYSDILPTDGSTDMSIRTHYQGGSRTNSDLLKLSLLYKHLWGENGKIKHKSIFGVGYLKTRVAANNSNSIMSFYEDSLGWVSTGMVLDKYEYFRNQNFYLIAGYEFTFKISDHLNWNAQIMYNQGLYKMIRWHTYRTYSESLTNYTEFDEQWSFTRLSYFAFLTGISYEFGAKKNKTN